MGVRDNVTSCGQRVACNNDVEEEEHETKREKVKQVGGHKVKTQFSYNRGSYSMW